LLFPGGNPSLFRLSKRLFSHLRPPAFYRELQHFNLGTAPDEADRETIIRRFHRRAIFGWAPGDRLQHRGGLVARLLEEIAGEVLTVLALVAKGHQHLAPVLAVQDTCSPASGGLFVVATLLWAATMQVFEERYGWKPVESAPLDRDVQLVVTDGRGAPYRLGKPCRRTASGWVSSSKGTVTPLKWRPCVG
jgi:hypothetical protein